MIRRLYLDSEVMTHIAPGRPMTDEELDRRVAAAEARWRQFGFDMWVLECADSGEFIGRGGLIFSDELGEVEVGYMLAREKWGQGFATELAVFALGFGFETVGLDRVVAVVDIPHLRSQRVLEKAGMHYQKDVTYQGDIVRYYQLERSDWEAAR